MTATGSRCLTWALGARGASGSARLERVLGFAACEEDCKSGSGEEQVLEAEHVGERKLGYSQEKDGPGRSLVFVSTCSR